MVDSRDKMRKEDRNSLDETDTSIQNTNETEKWMEADMPPS